MIDVGVTEEFLIREAKKAGVDITCETAPHYLVLCDKQALQFSLKKTKSSLSGDRLLLKYDAIRPARRST